MSKNIIREAKHYVVGRRLGFGALGLGLGKGIGYWGEAFGLGIWYRGVGYRSRNATK
jgi:hypothetical protein